MSLNNFLLYRKVEKQTYEYDGSKNNGMILINDEDFFLLFVIITENETEQTKQREFLNQENNIYQSKRKREKIDLKIL